MPFAFISSLWGRLPFAGRLLFTASFALVVAGTTMLYASALGDAKQARSDLAEQLAGELQAVPASLAELLVIGDFTSIQQALDSAVTRSNLAAVRYRDASGAVLSSRDQPIPSRAPAAFARWLNLSQVSGQADAIVGARRYGVIEITLTPQHAINRSWERLTQHMAILLLAIALDFLGIWLVLRAGLRPLSALDAGAQALKQGELAARILPQGSPELRRLIDSFNAMAEAVQNSNRRLIQENERVQVTLASIGDAVIATDANGQVEFMNPVAEALTGWPSAEAKGQPITSVFRVMLEASRQPAYNPVMRALRDGRIVVMDSLTLLVARDGSERPVADSAAPIRAETGAIIGAVLVFRDQSGEREKLHRLNLLASVFEHTHEGIVITDAERRILEVNPAFTTLTGYASNEVIGKTPGMLRSDRHDDEFYVGMQHALRETGHWSGEIWNRRKNGEVFAELENISAIRDANGQITHFVGIFTDITLQKQHEERLRYIAHYDALTNLPNRILLADRLHLALAQTKRAHDLMAICYLDLDGFKPVNDTLGHEIGDRLLMEVARRLAESMRGGDTVARLGGDEFVLLLPGLTTVDECEKGLARLLRRVAEPYPINGHKVGVSASIGVTLYPFDDADADTLLRHADQSMYSAKQAGRNRYQFYDFVQDQRQRARTDILDRMKAGLLAGEFRLYFQPKVDMRRGVVVGAEALIRWLHPERGLLPPMEFLPLLDGSDFAAAIDTWVLDAALSHLAQWKMAGLDLSVSVNISATLLQDERFPNRLGELLARHPTVPGGRLEIEVLETAAHEDIHRVSEVIDACSKLGVSFALDDFGTGYSSLTYFRRLPASTLKIDQSFVRDMLKDPDDLAIVEGVIGLAQAFRRNVVAEGVETAEHGILLLELGCDVAQGYGIARPMSAEALPAWVASFAPDPRWAAAVGGYHMGAPFTLALNQESRKS
ncbi:MAG: EAL domain-containing protein [Hydrogenophilales bacterium]|nr:EAL domain-containing protein [Hydrogenophilales bacterium]